MKSPGETRTIVAALEAMHPAATTVLHYRDPWELLVATILSAQTTDQRVNQVTPALFRRFPDAMSLARASADDVEAIVRPTGFFRQKARAIVGVARALVDRHGGLVPASMSALVELPGVGRKTANVVLGHALGVPGLAVDRHVLRVANRIGIASSEDPDIVEQQITQAFPPAAWTLVSDTLILHGRRICKPRPLCDRCSVRASCEFAAGMATTGAGARKAAAPSRRARSMPARKSRPSAAGPARRRRSGRRAPRPPK
jgi:endonuclease-3